MNLESLRQIIAPQGEPLPAEKAEQVKDHYRAVAERHNLNMTGPLRFAIEHTPSLYVRGMCKPGEFADNRKGISMFGTCGTGKTVAFAFLEYCYETMNRKLRMVSATEMAQHFSTGGDRLFWEIARGFDGLPLAVDDLGSERDTKHFGNANPIAEFIMHRYSRWQLGGPETHWNGNLNTKDFVKRYGARVYDRIKEFTIPVQFTGGSLRGAKTEATTKRKAQ